MLLKTDIRLPDTDGDQYLDGIEFRLGTNPALDDALADLDFDGVPNGQEIAAGTDPTRPDPNRYRDERMIYSTEDLGILSVKNINTGKVEQRECHRFEVKGIEMVVTPLVGQERGLNRILIYTTEKPSLLGGTPPRASVACFEAFYLGENNKNPEN